MRATCLRAYEKYGDYVTFGPLTSKLIGARHTGGLFVLMAANTFP